MWMIPSLCKRYVKLSRKDKKELKYSSNGVRKIDRSLDLVTLIRTQKRLITLEKVLFDKQQLILSKLTRENYLSLNSSTSEHEEEFGLHDLKHLRGYTVDPNELVNVRLLGK